MSLSNILLIPGVGGDLQELRGLLFGNGQAGWMGIPSLDNTAIAANTLGSGIETFRDLYRGNNGTQGTADQRSAWGRVPKRGRVNQIIHTEDATNAAWQLPTSDTFTNVTTTDENGATVNALRLAPTVANTTHQVRQTGLTSQNYSWSALMKADGETQVSLWIDAARAGRFTLTGSGTVSTAGSNVAASILHVGNGWYLCQMNSTVAGTIANIYLRTGAAYIGNINEAVLIRLPQCEPGTARTAYQRVTTAFDITEPGQPSCYYLQPDGVNDGYVTGSNLDLSGTDKVTVFAAVRKLSDAARGMLVELTTAGNASFRVESPSGLLGDYAFGSQGTVNQSVFAAAAAATTNIITGIGSISGPLATIRNNGVQVQTSSASQGTGNYSNALLYIFRRAGLSLPANLQCFALIVAGGSYSTATIQRVEQILSKYTPGVTL